MNWIENCDITALFGIFLETNQHQNLIRPIKIPKWGDIAIMPELVFSPYTDPGRVFDSCGLGKN